MRKKRTLKVKRELRNSARTEMMTRADEKSRIILPRKLKMARQYPLFPYISDEPNHDPAEDATAAPVTDGGSSLDPTAVDTLVVLCVCSVAIFLAWRLAKLVVPRCRGPIQPQQRPDSTDDAPHFFRL